jgi:hypothetical protein
VSRLDEPIPSLTPFAVQFPALTTIRLAPADITCCSTTACAPEPNATIVMTDVTAMASLRRERPVGQAAATYSRPLPDQLPVSFSRCAIAASTL